MVRLLDRTMIRVGNDAYAQKNNSFGLTTLRSRHLEIEGSSLRFLFKGKSRQERRLKLSDRRVASVVRAIGELPGQSLFRYLDEDGGRRDIGSQDVNDYIRAATGGDFTSKHFHRAPALRPLREPSSRLAGSVRTRTPKESNHGPAQETGPS